MSVYRFTCALNRRRGLYQDFNVFAYISRIYTLILNRHATSYDLKSLTADRGSMTTPSATAVGTLASSAVWVVRNRLPTLSATSFGYACFIANTIRLCTK